MINFDKRLDRIEGKIATANAPVKLVLIHVNEPGAAEQEKKTVDEYFSKYGSLSGLTIVHTHVVKPQPLPAGFTHQGE